jgi:hypothetical protein
MFVRNYELAARRSSAIKLGRPDRRLDLDRCQQCRPEALWELLHNLLHDPGLWRPTRGIISKC